MNRVRILRERAVAIVQQAVLAPPLSPQNVGDGRAEEAERLAHGQPAPFRRSGAMILAKISHKSEISHSSDITSS